MKRKIVFVILQAIIIYIIIVSIFLFSIPLMVRWGNSEPFYLRAIRLAENIPLSLVSTDKEVHLNYIFINAGFWTVIFTLILSTVLIVFRKWR